MIYIFFIEDDEKIRTILLELNPSFVFFFPLLILLCIICTSIFFIIFVMVMIDDFTYHMYIYIWCTYYIYGWSRFPNDLMHEKNKEGYIGLQILGMKYPMRL